MCVVSAVEKKSTRMYMTSVFVQWINIRAWFTDGFYYSNNIRITLSTTGTSVKMWDNAVESPKQAKKKKGNGWKGSS